MLCVVYAIYEHDRLKKNLQTNPFNPLRVLKYEFVAHYCVG